MMPSVLQHLLLIALSTTSVLAGVSENFARPSNIIGIDDLAYTNNIGISSNKQALLQRYHQMQADIQPNTHRFNVYWSSYESSPVPSSVTPVDCPPGFRLLGGAPYLKYRCISEGAEAQIQGQLSVDAEMGWQSAAIIWCAPAMYRDPQCLGMPEGAVESAPDTPSAAYDIFKTALIQNQGNTQLNIDSVLQETAAVIEEYTNSTDSAGIESASDASGCSCVPTDAFMDDWQDFVTYVSLLKADDGSSHGFTHYVIWNENANNVWADLSPSIDPLQPIPPDGVQLWINKIADLMRRAHTAIAVSGRPSLMYLSTDRLWEVPPTLTDWNIGRAHIGTKNLMDGIWQALGVDIDWSLAVHAYGVPLNQELDVASGISAYTFATLGQIAAYMSQNLGAVSGNTTDAPQLLMSATEQGWTSSTTDDNTRATYICQAHSLSLALQGMVFVSHNDFQNYGSDIYSLVPASVDQNLDNGATSVTYQAYSSLNPSTWGMSSNHWCCQNVQVGCP